MRRVLLVGDDQFLRQACEVSFRQRGFEVTAAADGEAGLAMALEQEFDAILLDLLMPKKPGMALLRALKASLSTRHVPIVILANSARADDQRRAKELGAAAYHAKANLSLRALGTEVAQLVGARRDEFQL